MLTESENGRRSFERYPPRAAEPPADTIANRGWLGWSLAGGIALGVPSGWLLAYLAALPALLGLFFFLLIGLLIGAVMFRLGKPAAPVPRGMLRPIGMAVALLVWVTGLLAEYRWFPEHAAAEVVRNSVIQSIPPSEVKQFENKMRREALDRLRADYPPGGFIGYLRWAAIDGQMSLPRMKDQSRYLYKLRQKRVIWVARVVLSLVLFTFALQSQFFGLAPRKPVAEDETSEGAAK